MRPGAEAANLKDALREYIASVNGEGKADPWEERVIADDQPGSHRPWPIASSCSGVPRSRHSPPGSRRSGSTSTATSNGRSDGASSKRFRTPDTARD